MIPFWILGGHFFFLHICMALFIWAIWMAGRAFVVHGGDTKLDAFRTAGVWIGSGRRATARDGRG
jgi:hypothetical protein